MIAIGLLGLLAVALYYDSTTSTIPNRYTAAGAVVGLVYHGWSGGLEGLLDSLLGLLSGFGLMVALYALRAIGAGDVKLFAAIGAMGGVSFVLNGALNSLLLACVIGIAIIAWRRELIIRLGNTYALLFNFLFQRDVRGLRAYRDKAVTFPFMYAVAPAIGLTSLYCPPLS
ncbi:MAG: hypothetical protein K0Q59_1021 [Paenibacillus sp.]|jgi:prepilin peptidase CpaA|nr:hypothetical protein [Paenibacillus sp.]